MTQQKEVTPSLAALTLHDVDSPSAQHDRKHSDDVTSDNEDIACTDSEVREAENHDEADVLARDSTDDEVSVSKSAAAPSAAVQPASTAAAATVVAAVPHPHHTQITAFRTLLTHRLSTQDPLHTDSFDPNSDYVLEAHHNDRFVSRYLTARHLDVSKALLMFTEACAYRKHNSIDTILDRPCPHAAALMSLSFQSLHHGDKQQHPVLIEQVGRQVMREVYGSDVGGLEARCYYHQYLMEYMVKRVLKSSNSSNSNTAAAHKITIIVDMKGLAFSQITKSNYAFVKHVATVNSLLYPEHLAVTLVVNCPRLFSVVWNASKGWLDVRTQEKIAILHGTGLAEMTKIIDANHLPAIFDGACTCSGCVAPAAADAVAASAVTLQQSPESLEFLAHVAAMDVAAAAATAAAK